MYSGTSIQRYNKLFFFLSNMKKNLDIANTFCRSLRASLYQAFTASKEYLGHSSLLVIGRLIGLIFYFIWILSLIFLIYALIIIWKQCWLIKDSSNYKGNRDIKTFTFESSAFANVSLILNLPKPMVCINLSQNWILFAQSVACAKQSIKFNLRIHPCGWLHPW